MKNQNDKPKNDLGLFAGSNRSKERDRYNPKHDNTGMKGDKDVRWKKGQVNTGTGIKKYNQRSNIGWLFYKDYYHGIDFRLGQEKDCFKEDFERNNEAITSGKLSQYRDEVEVLKSNFQTVQSFELTTEYPGLVTGLGSPHESHKEGEYKLGFYFDHTTGLPVIPGSSVKGVLRSTFKKSPAYIEYILQNPEVPNHPIPGIDIGKLEEEIFDGEKFSPYQRDVFLDAVIVSAEDKNTLFLADDFITPHPDEFKDPIPLQFLKVLPQVTFRFQFRLNNKGLIPSTAKADLFKRILKDLGIGAKTNVGYGKFKK
jgi:CRISPR-associated protein Cmr6